MRAIALTQPWATLWVGREKVNETRSWATGYRGDLAVLASKGFPGWAKELVEEEPFKSALWRLGFNSAGELPTGKIVGIVRVTDCLPITRLSSGIPADPMLRLPDGMRPVFEPERSFGDYAAGRYAWVTEDSRMLQEPIPYKGRLGLFDVPDELLAQAQVA